MVDDLAGVRENFYVDKKDRLCPLCGVHLPIPPFPQAPCTTLEALAEHFWKLCPVTARSGLPSVRRRRASSKRAAQGKSRTHGANKTPTRH